MKKFYHTLAIAAIAAVSMFSAQSATAQTASSTSSAPTYIDAEDDEPELGSSLDDDLYDAIMQFCRMTFQAHLEHLKANNTLVTKAQALDLIAQGNKYGFTALYVLSYLTNIAPY